MTALDRKLWWISPRREPELAADLSTAVKGLLKLLVGGPSRHQLFMGVSEVDESDKAKILRTGSIRYLTVTAAGHGVP